MHRQRSEIDQAAHGAPSQPARPRSRRWLPFGVATLLGALAIGAAGFTLYRSSPLAAASLSRAEARLVIQNPNAGAPRVQHIEPLQVLPGTPPQGDVASVATAQDAPANEPDGSQAPAVEPTLGAQAAAPVQALAKSAASAASTASTASTAKPTGSQPNTGGKGVGPSTITAPGRKRSLTAQTSCPKPVGQVLTHTLSSAITAAPITVNVYVPPCYNPNEYTYPTLYLIHGTAFEQGGWLFDGVPRVADIGMSLGTLPPFIIVMPGADMRAGDASKYSWSNTGNQSYEGFVVKELVPYIDARYSTWASREGRAIGGISRGAYWSIEIGFSNPDKFSTVGGHSPSVYTQLVGMPDHFSMLDTAKSRTALHSLRIWLDAGSDDWARIDMNKLTDDLDEAGVTYRSSIGNGAHEDAYWTSRVPEYLSYYAQSWPVKARVARPMSYAFGKRR